VKFYVAEAYADIRFYDSAVIIDRGAAFRSAEMDKVLTAAVHDSDLVIAAVSDQSAVFLFRVVPVRTERDDYSNVLRPAAACIQFIQN
jgi:hypothetical protein